MMPLRPQFDAIPPELRIRARWVTWGGWPETKVPYDARTLNTNAKSNDPNTWAAFDQAQTAYEEGNRDGVGFVLNGDGVAGIDLDHCVADGVPKPEALRILDGIGCGYIELSPSGTGLHGYGFVEPLQHRKVGTIDGVNVELYTSARFLTVTGHALRKGPLTPLPGFAAAAEQMTHRGQQRMTDESSFCAPLCSSVGIPPDCLPDGPGERIRNRKLFRFARYLKGKMPDATREELRALVREWHRQALPMIGTKDFATSWADFLRGWEKVRVPLGDKLAGILADLPALPDGIAELGYGEHAQELVRVCMALAVYHNPEVFFLSARTAGELIGADYSDAAAMLRTLRADGVIGLVKAGAGMKASRYRLTWPNASERT